ncbi:hypothetical protein Slin14017_G128270 [Septoria linicola]|nr:hypothetical protein Slin14017_G128270 [Septoria linicola]
MSSLETKLSEDIAHFRRQLQRENRYDRVYELFARMLAMPNNAYKGSRRAGPRAGIVIGLMACIASLTGHFGRIPGISNTRSMPELNLTGDMILIDVQQRKVLYPFPMNHTTALIAFHESVSEHEYYSEIWCLEGEEIAQALRQLVVTHSAPSSRSAQLFFNGTEVLAVIDSVYQGFVAYHSELEHFNPVLDSYTESTSRSAKALRNSLQSHARKLHNTHFLLIWLDNMLGLWTGQTAGIKLEEKATAWLVDFISATYDHAHLTESVQTSGMHLAQAAVHLDRLINDHVQLLHDECQTIWISAHWPLWRRFFGVRPSSPRCDRMQDLKASKDKILSKTESLGTEMARLREDRRLIKYQTSQVQYYLDRVKRAASVQQPQDGGGGGRRRRRRGRRSGDDADGDDDRDEDLGNLQFSLTKDTNFEGLAAQLERFDNVAAARKIRVSKEQRQSQGE